MVTVSHEPLPTATTTPTPTQTLTPNSSPTHTLTLTSTPTAIYTSTSTSFHTPTITGTPTPPVFTPTSTTPTATPTLNGNLSSVRVNAPSRTIAIGESFTVGIDLNLLEASRGGQAGLTFNPQILRADLVSEGNFYKDWAQANGAFTQMFPAPIIDNVAGTISTTAVLILGGTGAPTGTGSLLMIQFTALKAGTSPLKLVDVIISDANIANTRPLNVTVEDGMVNAGSGGTTGTPAPTQPITTTPTTTQTPQQSATVTSTPTITPTLSSESRLSIVPSDQVGAIGQVFEIEVRIEVASGHASRGAQAGFNFNPNVLRCDKVTEGTFYKNWAQANDSTTTLFPAPIINNTSGTISVSSVIVLGQTSGGASGSGSLFNMTCTSLAAGTSHIRIVSGEVADDNLEGSGALTLSIIDGQVTVTNQVLPTSTPTSTATRTQLPSATPTITRTLTPTHNPTFGTRTHTPGPSPTSIGALKTSNAARTTVPTVAANARMSINPPVNLVASVGEAFTFEVTIQSDKPVRGAMVAIKFDSSIMSCERVEEGGFFKDWATRNGGSTFVYPEPKIDNNTGSVSSASIIITGAVTGPESAAGGPTEKGVFFRLRCTGKAVGVGAIRLEDVELSNDNIGATRSLAVAVENGQVFVGVTPTPGGPGPNSNETATFSSPAEATNAALYGTVTPTQTPTPDGSATVAPTAGIKADADSKVVVASAPTDGTDMPGMAVASIESLVDSNGMAIEDIQIFSPDNLVAIRIGKGTQLLTADNRVLKSIAFAPAQEIPDAGENMIIVSVVYDLGPDGATFDPPATLGMAYDQARLPQGANEKKLSIARYDPEKQEWSLLKSKVDPETGVVEAEIGHFSIYAVVFQPGSVNWTAIIIGSLIIEALIGAGLFVYMRRRKPVPVVLPEILLLPPPRQELPEIIVVAGDQPVQG
jgi:hypothetical protein